MYFTFCGGVCITFWGKGLVWSSIHSNNANHNFYGQAIPMNFAKQVVVTGMY